MEIRLFVYQMKTLNEPFLQELANELNDANTVGVALAGSQARGAGGPYSDVDIHHFVRQMPANPMDLYSMRIVDGYLVSVSLYTLEDAYAGLQNPKRAIWSIPGLRQLRILLDKDGLLAGLKAFAEKATWGSLQVAADTFASWNLAGCAEEIYKILAGLSENDESKTVYATWGLTRELAETLLIQGGVLVPTENVFINLVQQAAGQESDWTRLFRLASGLDPLPAGEPAWQRCGLASLRLYIETARRLQPILTQADACVVNQTIAKMEDAGYSWKWLN